MDSSTQSPEGQGPPLDSVNNPISDLEVFVISEAGKPIYTFSRREDAVTLMPLCTTLMSYARRTQNQNLMSMKISDNFVANFTTRPPFIFIVIYEAESNIDPNILLEQVEAQIVSIVTAKTIRSVFDDRPTFDLKRLLYGSEKLIDSIINLTTTLPIIDWPYVQGFIALTSSHSSSILDQGTNHAQSHSPTSDQRPHRVLMPVVSMTTSSRENLSSTINSFVVGHSNNMVFSLLFRLAPNYEKESSLEVSGDTNRDFQDSQDDYIKRGGPFSFELVTICNHYSKHKLKIVDIQIILALIEGSKAQLASVESLWMPVCLPRFNQDAYLHSYISYTNKLRYCLVMLSVDRDEFSNCQKARDAIEKKIDTILKDGGHKNKFNYQMSPLVHPILLELQEKLMSNQLDEEELAQVQQQFQIYNSKVESYHARQLQFFWYQTSKQVVWWQRSTRRPATKVLFYLTRKMFEAHLKSMWLKFSDKSVYLGWHVPTFQLYAQFDSTITTNEATEVIQRITNWIKKEEDNFSIKDYR